MKRYPLILLLLLAGCTLAEVKVEVQSERTTLENQVLGTYNALDREMLLLASVRGVDAQGEIREPPTQSGEQRDAVAAMQVMAFHEDDVDAFKRLGWVGENRMGTLTAFEMDRTGTPEDLSAFARDYPAEELEAVVAQVNEARETLMRRVIETNESLTDADLDRVRRVFGRLNAENALPGEQVQTPDGTWAVAP